MQFSTAAMMAIVAATASAAPVQRDDSQHFLLLSIRSGSPVHQRVFAENDNNIWLGKDTVTFCPSESVDCSNYSNDTTAFTGAPGNPVAISPYAVVPGGQHVYIAPGGAMKVTVAHSGFEPAGSVETAFSFASDGTNDRLAPVVNGSTSFFACPATADQKTVGPWQIFADVEGVQVPSGCIDDCYGIAALVDTYTGKPAWQYD